MITFKFWKFEDHPPSPSFVHLHRNVKTNMPRLEYIRDSYNLEYKQGEAVYFGLSEESFLKF